MTEEKPVAIVLPSWDPNEPRFKVTECPKCSSDRQFKNGKCVYNQRLGLCYSVDEIVEILNQPTTDSEFQQENEKLKWSNKVLRANRKDCEHGRVRERRQWEAMDNMRIEQIKKVRKENDELREKLNEDLEVITLLQERENNLKKQLKPPMMIAQPPRMGKTVSFENELIEKLQLQNQLFADENKELKETIQSLDEQNKALIAYNKRIDDVIEQGGVLLTLKQLKNITEETCNKKHDIWDVEPVTDTFGCD